MKFTSILNLLIWTTVRCEQNLEVNLINRLNNFFNFDHNIFIMDPSEDYTQYIPESNFTTHTIYVFDPRSDSNNGSHPAVLWTQFIKNRGQRTFLIVVTKENSFHTNSSLLDRVREIRRVVLNVKIWVIFTGNATSLTIAEQLFRWSWNNGIVNIFCSFHALSLNVVRFDPFVTFDLINLTNSESLGSYFPDKKPNYRNDSIYFTQLYGNKFERSFWGSVCDAVNASMVKFNRTLHNRTSWDAHFNIIYNVSEHEGIVLLYPYGTTSDWLLVPHAQPYSNIIAYLQNASWKLLFAYTFTVIVVATLILTISTYLRTKKILPFRCACDVINMLMNDNGNIRYGQLCMGDIFVLVPLTFTGLIIMNGIVSVFQSYLTQPIYEPQINSLERLFMSPLPIMSVWKNYTIERLELVSHHSGWGDKVVDEGNLNYVYEMVRFNSSNVAYVADYADVERLLLVQKRLNLEAYYWLSETYLDKTFESFHVSPRFPFVETVNDIILRFVGAGLVHKLLEYDNTDKVNSLWRTIREIQLIQLERTDQGRDNEEFAVPAIVWSGWIGSVILFICEIIWKKISGHKLFLDLFQ